MRLVCSECGAGASAVSLFCASCRGLLAFELDVPAERAASLRALFAERRSSQAARDRSGVWRFRELLPPLEAEPITLQENLVPVIEARTAADYAGATHLTYLHLGNNPTGSFKDAGMSVAISHAKASGARLAVCASTGNTA